MNFLPAPLRRVTWLPAAAWWDKERISTRSTAGCVLAWFHFLCQCAGSLPLEDGSPSAPSHGGSTGHHSPPQRRLGRPPRSTADRITQQEPLPAVCKYLTLSAPSIPDRESSEVSTDSVGGSNQVFCSERIDSHFPISEDFGL